MKFERCDLRMHFESLDQFLKDMKRIGETKNIYIWGVSAYGNLLGQLFDRNGIFWSGYFDNFSVVSGNKLNSKCIFKKDQIDVSPKAVYVLSMRSYQEVKKQLILAGIDKKQIVFFDNIDFFDSIGNAAGYSVSEKLIKSLHNIHKGEKCFVIGNGPSLKVEDLNKIKKAEITSFASNMIFKCYDQTHWRPNYYFCADGNEIRKTFKDSSILNYVSQNSKYVFIRNSGDLRNCAIENIPNLVFYRSAFSENEQKFEFSQDCSEKIYSGYSVTYTILQMAVYMGFSEIYLLGIDHNYSMEKQEDGNVIKNKGVKDHSEILGNYGINGVVDIYKPTCAFRSAQEHAELHNIKIYNATRGGRLEIFERVQFDSLFG